MTRYDKILDKVAPTFYKLVQYQSYSRELLEKYLWHAKIPVTTFPYTLRIKDINYYYYVDFYTHLSEGNEGIPINVKDIVLTTKNKAEFFKERFAFFNERITMPEFIVNMIINKFSFENEQIVFSDGLPLPYTLKDLFIALVGKDMYDTIRQNIK